MARTKNEKKTAGKKTKSDALWRKPISLDSFEDEDPLATLYQGREGGDKKREVEILPKKTESFQKTVTSAKSDKSTVRMSSKPTKTVNKSKATASTKITVEELKNLLKIKSDSFQFTDIREILRGRSLDIYAYLNFLAGDAGVCKITHNDLMKALDISRPTLFKQGDWLERLFLIEKHSVPGDHLGTSYTVRRLENTLPVSNKLVKQLESYTDTIGKRN